MALGTEPKHESKLRSFGVCRNWPAGTDDDRPPNINKTNKAMYNKAQIIGHLGADPELRQTQNETPVTTLSVATSEKWKDENEEIQQKTQWHRVVAWGRTAEIAGEYLKKGSLAMFEGPIEYRKWEDKDGNERISAEIKALNIRLLEKADH